MTRGPCPGDPGLILAILGLILAILGRILAILGLILAILGRILAILGLVLAILGLDLAAGSPGQGAFFSRPKSIHFGREKKTLPR